MTRKSILTAFVGRSHSKCANRMSLDQPEFHCTPQEIQQGCGNAGTHVDLNEQHNTGLLPESAGNGGALDDLGSFGGRSTNSPLQQHCGRPETLCDRKRSAEATAVSRPDHEPTFTNQPVRHRQSRWRRKCSKRRSSLG